MKDTFSHSIVRHRLSILFLILYTLLFCGCSQPSPESFVENIYTDILPDYQQDVPKEEQYYARYCSEDLQHWLSEEEAIATDRNEIFVIDWSLWISAQDYNRDIALKSVEREANAPKGVVWVTATLRNFGTDCPVCEDSCMEFFFSPCPDDGRYFNLEINPNGSFFLGFGHGRGDLKRLHPEVSVFDIRTLRTPDGWETFYRIPLSFIREFYPDYAFTSGLRIRANCYKCGDMTEKPHYLSWNTVSCETPDFHRPEDFGEMIFE